MMNYRDIPDGQEFMLPDDCTVQVRGTQFDAYGPEESMIDVYPPNDRVERAAPP